VTDQISSPFQGIAALLRRSLYLFLLATVAGAAFAQCEERVELVFTFWGSTFEKQAIEEAVANFNATHPCIRVNAQHTAVSGYVEKLSTMLAGGNPPDVAYLGEGQAFQWAEAGEILDLEPYFASQPADESLLETTYYRFDEGEKLMGTGLATGVMLLYYNKRLFDEAGIEYPPADPSDAWTWDEFLEVSKLLTRDRRGNSVASANFDPNNVDVYGVAFPQWWGGWLPFVLSNGGNIANDEGTELLLNQPEAVEVFEAMQDMIHVHHVTPTPAQTQTLPAADIMMQSGKVAMSIDGMWKVVDFSQLGFEWGMAPLPYFDEPTTIILSAPKVIFSRTEHPEEAFEFYRYISDPQQNDLFTGGLWSPLEERYYTDPQYTRRWLEGEPGVYPPEARQVLVEYTLNYAPHQPAPYWLRNFGQINAEVLGPAISRIWAGEASPQEALDQAVAGAQRLLQGRW
jgi:multiple sugar transport system substrate-binding protein